MASLSVQLGSITHISMMTHSRRHLVHNVQVSNAHGWHGARNMARANEQRKQQQQQQQKQKQQQQKQQQEQKQKQKLVQKQLKQQQQQDGGGKTRVSSLSPDSAGAHAVDGVEARIYPPFAHTATSRIAICWLFILLTTAILCVGPVGRVGEGQGRCECA